MSTPPGGSYYVTEAGEAALAAGVAPYTPLVGGPFRASYITEQGEAALAAAEQLDLKRAATAADRALARLEKAFPQFMIWFAKISHTTVVWTARLNVGEGSVQEYSPSALQERLTALVARMPKSA